MSWSYVDLMRVVLIGVGATAVLDVFALLRAKMTGQPAMNWALVGHWLGHVAQGTLVLPRPEKASPVVGEKALGWIFHYGVGIGLAAVFTFYAGPSWLHQPPMVQVISFGAATVVLPWLIMQPGLGMGVAARRMPKPWAARGQSLTTHVVFGVGLYLSAVALQSVF